MVTFPITTTGFYKPTQSLVSILLTCQIPCRSCESYHHHGNTLHDVLNRQLELTSCNCDHGSLIQWAKHRHGIKCWNGQQYIYLVDMDCATGSEKYHTKFWQYKALAYLAVHSQSFICQQCLSQFISVQCSKCFLPTVHQTLCYTVTVLAVILYVAQSSNGPSYHSYVGKLLLTQYGSDKVILQLTSV